MRPEPNALSAKCGQTAAGSAVWQGRLDDSKGPTFGQGSEAGAKRFVGPIQTERGQTAAGRAVWQGRLGGGRYC